MSGTQLEKDVQFARHLRENGGIAGREMVLPHPHKAAAQTAPNKGGDQIAQGIAQLPPNQPAKRSAAQPPSAEFTGHYGSSLTNSQFLTLLYANALHRAPDAGGLAWWLTEMSSNPSATRASAVTSFSESTECQALFVGVITAGVDYIPVV